MTYLKVSEMAEKWNMSRRRVQDLCRMNLISGAQRWGAGLDDHLAVIDPQALKKGKNHKP